ncbi:MAG: hypothetical protein F6K35_40265 [Okeania sp. SIO2H7]|nr:hypothetical protein [Okeania sp. SIO2H7]
MTPNNLQATSKTAQQLYQEAWLLKEEMKVLTLKLQALNRQVANLNYNLPELPEERELLVGDRSDCDWFDR